MNCKDILVSIIVPIYNVRDYVGKCIESICGQTHENIEIILVDDGSDDGSGNICDNFAGKDDRIKVIHKQNGGITSARGGGVKIAQGAYIGFVDGDDWVEPDMYEELLQQAVENKAQIVLSDMYRHKFTGEVTIWSGAGLPEGIYELAKDRELISTSLISGINSEHKGINGGVHIKLFERNILQNHIVLIDDIVHGYADDKVIVYPIILHSDKICVVHKAYYHGVDRKDSATHSVNKYFFEQMQWVYMYLQKVFEEQPYREILLEQLHKLMMISSISNVNNLVGKAIVPIYFLKDIKKFEGKKIVLYGAGKVGTDFYQQIKSSGLGNIVLWVDKNERIEKEVYSIEKILDTQYDLILVAVAEKMLADIIKHNLIEMGILDSKIFWDNPVNIIEYFGQYLPEA